MKLISNNLVFANATTMTASSHNVNFPVSNLSHYFRSKTWRSSGHFYLDATNNRINFKESSGGSQLTATVFGATYTPTTLAVEIKAALEAAGTNQYTVTFSSVTGKWTISSNGTYFSLLNNTGTNQSTSLLKLCLGFANTDRTGSLTYTGSNIAIHTDESIVFDFQTIEDVDSIILLWPKEDGIRLSASAVVKIQANATNVWTSPTVNQTMTIDNTYSMFSHYFSTVQSYRYWRISIADPTNPNLWIDLGIAIIGQGEAITSADNGFVYGLEDASQITRTDYGNEYVDEFPQIATLTLPFSVLSYSDAEIIDNAYRINGTRIPVFVALDQTASVFSKDHFAIYGKFQGGFELNHVNYNLFETKKKIREVI